MDKLTLIGYRASGQPIYLARGGSQPDTPPANPDADELAALRKDKADRAAAEAKERDKELEELRAFKAGEEERARKKVTAPTLKADKPAAPTPPAPVADSPVVKKRSPVSRAWFGDTGE